MEGGPLLEDWWKKASGNFVPYLNITARWDGAPDQDQMKEKGGRGFPYCTIMDSSGEVIWEARPSSEAVWNAAVADATKLVAMKDSKSKNKALKASIDILDALGRNQREQVHDLKKLDAMAKIKGVDEEVLSRFQAWRGAEEFSQAFRKSRQDGGVAVYELFKAGKMPPKEDRMRLAFLFYATNGAIKSGDAKAATSAVDLFETEGSVNERMAERVKQDATKLRKQIEDL